MKICPTCRNEISNAEFDAICRRINRERASLTSATEGDKPLTHICDLCSQKMTTENAVIHRRATGHFVRATEGERDDFRERFLEWRYVESPSTAAKEKTMEEVYTCSCGNQSFIVYSDRVGCTRCGDEIVVHISQPPSDFNNAPHDVKKNKHFAQGKTATTAPAAQPEER